MTPQLQQAIKMLQLSNLELTGFVEAEIEQNPLLERGERESEDGAAQEAEPQAEPSTVNGAAEALPEALAADDGSDAADHWRAAAGEEGDGRAEIGGDLGGDIHSWRSGNGVAPADDLPGIEQAAARPRTLREHLIEQIGADLPDQADRVIALHLLDQLDEAGYLQGGLAGAAERLGCGPAQLERVLARLQEFDPPGVFARDLAECLGLQLRDRDRLDPAMQRLLDNLPLLAARNAAALMRLCGVDAEDLAEMVAEIKSLDPRPGFAFDPPLAQPVVPDILMRAQLESLHLVAPDAMAVVLQDWECLSPKSQRALIADRDAHDRRFAEVLTECKNQGLVATDDHLYRLYLIGALNWTVRWYRVGGEMTLDELARQFADFARIESAGGHLV